MLKNIIILLFVSLLSLISCDKEERKEEKVQQTECLASEEDCSKLEAGQQAGSVEAGEETSGTETAGEIAGTEIQSGTEAGEEDCSSSETNIDQGVNDSCGEEVLPTTEESDMSIPE